MVLRLMIVKGGSGIEEPSVIATFKICAFEGCGMAVLMFGPQAR